MKFMRRNQKENISKKNPTFIFCSEDENRKDIKFKQHNKFENKNKKENELEGVESKSSKILLKNQKIIERITKDSSIYNLDKKLRRKSKIKDCINNFILPSPKFFNDNVNIQVESPDSKPLCKQNNTIEGTGSSLLNVPSFNRSVNLIGQRSPSIDQMIENNDSKGISTFRYSIEERSSIIKNALLNAPGGQLHRGSMIFTRQDVIMLETWMTEQIRKLEDESVSQNEKEELTMCILNIAMEEITKHLFIQCKEQGALLEFIWRSMLMNIKSSEVKNIRSTELMLEFEQNKSKQLKEESIEYQNKILELKNKIDLLTSELSLQSNSLSNNANKIDNDNRISTENATDNEMNLKAPKSHINDEDILLNGVRSKFVKLTREATINKVPTVNESSDTDMEEDIKRLDKVAPELIQDYDKEKMLDPDAIEEEKVIIEKITKIQNVQFNSKKTDTDDLNPEVDEITRYHNMIKIGSLVEKEIDSKQQEVDLSMLNDQILSDEPSNDLESEASDKIDLDNEDIK